MKDQDQTKTFNRVVLSFRNLLKVCKLILIFTKFKRKRLKITIKGQIIFQRLKQNINTKTYKSKYNFQIIDLRLRMRDRRPMRPSQIDSSQDATTRIKQMLKADISMLQQQNALLKTKCKKLNELQDRVQLVLRQNNQLLGENEKMSRILHQHKQENQMLRGKLQQQSNQKIMTESQYSFKEKKLMAEIQSLNQQMLQLQQLKAHQLNQMKSQFQQQLQVLKRQHSSSADIYQQQIRKLKDILDRRQLQINQLSNKLKKGSTELEYQIVKARQDRDQMNREIQIIEQEHQREIQEVRLRLEEQFSQEMEMIKRAHINELQQRQQQYLRMKDMIDHVSSDNTRLNQQLSSSTVYYQDTISLLNKQIDQLKIQLIELQKISQTEKIQLQRQLARIHQEEMQELREIQQGHLRKLQGEMISVQGANQARATEIDQLLREKTTARSVFDNETARLKQQIMLLKQKAIEQQSSFTNKLKTLQNRIQQKDKQIVYLQQLYRDMKTNSDSENASLKQLLSQKKIDYQKLRILQKETEQAALQEKNTLINEKQQLKQALRREQKQKSLMKDNLQSTLSQTESSLRSKIQSLITKINMIQKQNDGLKKNILLRQKQNKGLNQRLTQSQNRQFKLQREITEYRQKLLNKDKKQNQALQQQKQRLEKSTAYLVDNLKLDHAAALRLEGAKQNQLKDKLTKKQKQLENLLKMHKKMCDEVKALTEQQANKKNIDLKFPGATADLIATKNMFDVFLKTKVLDICGDAKEGKQNLFIVDDQ